MKTLAEARHALAEIESKIANNEYDPKKSMTVNDYWQIYSENRIKTGRWAPDTIVDKRNVYNRHFAKKYGNMRLKNIERLEYEKYMTGLLKRLTRSSVRQINSVFEAMLNDAVVNGYLDKNSVFKIYIGESKNPPKNKRISLDEFREWDACARKLLTKYEYAMVRLTYFGLRKSEVFGVKLGSLKLIGARFKKLLDESRTFYRPNGKGMKTKSSERYIVVDEETTKLLQFAIKFSRKLAKESGRILNKNDFLFLDAGEKNKKTLGQPVACSRIYVVFRKVNEACDMHITPHMMRHFFATQGQIAGVPVEHMAAALGHSTAYMTQKYTHIKDEVASEVTDSFLRAIK